MKNYFIPFILVVIFLNFMSCNKDGDLSEPGAALQNRTTGIFQDTTGVEFFHILYLLNIDNDSIEAFHERYGWPSISGSHEKKDNTTKITSVPMVKNNKITGIFKIYNTYEDSIRIHFFSKEDLEFAIDTVLNTYDFHMYFGAIQSYYFSSAVLEDTVNSEFEIWLQTNLNRMEERVVYHCIEWWDCQGEYRSDKTGIHYNNTSFSQQTGWTLYEGSNRKPYLENCYLLERECWLQGGNFITSFGNNWNNYSWISSSAGGYLNLFNNNTKVKPWEAQVLLDAKDCLQEAGIKGVMAKAGLEEAANNSCSRSYNSLLVETYINLIEQNKDCTDGNAWMEEMENTINKLNEVSSEEMEAHEEFFQSAGITDEETKRKLISGNSCGEDFQVIIPKIDMATASCDEIFKQFIHVLWMEAYAAKCFKTKKPQRPLNWETYFDNMQNSKTCSNVDILFKGLRIMGSIDYNFTLSANPDNQRYKSNSNPQHNGTTIAGGIEKESYFIYGPNSNAPLIHFGINSTHDQNFTKLMFDPCFK